MKTDVEPESKPAGKKKPGIQALIDDALSFTWTDIKIIYSLLLVAHVEQKYFFADTLKPVGLSHQPNF